MWKGVLGSKFCNQAHDYETWGTYWRSEIEDLGAVDLLELHLGQKQDCWGILSLDWGLKDLKVLSYKLENISIYRKRNISKE